MKKLLCLTTIDTSFKMYSKISLIFLFVLLSIIHGKAKENAPPTEDVKNFGPDRYCILEYGGLTNQTRLVEFYPTAKFWGVAKIADYTLVQFHSTILNGESITLTPECGKVAYAAAVLYPSQCYEQRVNDATLNDKNQQHRYAVNVIAEVTPDGKPSVKVACSLFVATEELSHSGNETPTETELATLVGGYRSAGFPDTYVNPIAAWTTVPDPPDEEK